MSKETENRRAAEERLHRAADGTWDCAFFALDREGGVEGWNPGAEKLLGYTGREILGRSWDIFFSPEDRAAGRPARLLEDARGRGTAADEGWRVRKDGSRFWADARLTALRDPEGSLQGYAHFLLDRTEARAAEEAAQARLLARVRDLEEANREIDAFASLAAHDLGVPLRAIRMYLETLKEQAAARLAPEEREEMGRLEAAAARMEALVRDLLAYSRLRAADLPRGKMDLADVVAEVLRDLGPALAQRGAAVAVEGDLPPVLGNRTGLARVLCNFAVNAATYVPPGVKPRIVVRAERRGARVRIWVEDNGIGIAPEHHARIFEPLERLHRQDEHPGTGLGLAIAKRAAERMGGAVGVESEPGKGSRFWVELPAFDPETGTAIGGNSKAAR
ncbi:MAG TPA: PAS domain-containing sensor histidine kinase [Planctomycetota bacterium]|nr:PAS domain-containing sensor histidine kinase [Planctomycetota bacterium]